MATTLSNNPMALNCQTPKITLFLTRAIFFLGIVMLQGCDKVIDNGQDKAIYKRRDKVPVFGQFLTQYTSFEVSKLSQIGDKNA